MRSADTLTAAMARAFVKTPQATAVRGPDGSITYGQIGTMCLALVDSFDRAGVSPNGLIALSGTRLSTTVATMAACLMSGRAFVVLDDEAPPVTTRAIVAATRPEAYVATGGLADDLGGIPTVPLPADEPQIIWDVAKLPDPVPDSVAYVVMTSGSTGKPKPVVVERGQLAAYVHAVLERLQVPVGSSFASVSPLWTDLGHTSVFGAFSSGGTVHLIGSDVATSAGALSNEFSKRPVDVLKITPSHLALLVAGHRDGRPPPLPEKVLVLGGERLPWPLVEHVRALRPDLAIVNHYGPSECVIGVAAGPVPKDLPAGFLTAPLGEALGMTRLLVRDVDDGPVAEGGVGELVVVGPTVARGYLTPDEDGSGGFGEVSVDGVGMPGYRTGDLVRSHRHGLLEILGRLDRQVKVAGFRVEPGELEAALDACPGVASSHAFPVLTDGWTALAAAVTTDAAVTLAEPQLLAHVRQSVTPSALPVRVLVLDSLPLAVSGKVDDTLLASLLDATVNPVASSPPRDAEGLVARLWEACLGHPVDPEVSLIRQGANSIAVIRFLASLQRETGVEIPLHVVFEYPTVTEISRMVEHGAPANAEPAGLSA